MARRAAHQPDRQEKDALDDGTTAASLQSGPRRRRGGDRAGSTSRQLTAAMQALSASQRGGSGARRGGPSGRARGPGRSPSRLRFLLSILLITSLFLVILQSTRHLRKRAGATSVGARLQRARHAFHQPTTSSLDQSNDGVALLDRWRAAALAALEAPTAPLRSQPSGQAADADRRATLEQREDPLNWQAYLKAMRRHFDEQIGQGATTTKTAARAKGTQDMISGSGIGEAKGMGLAMVPGEAVQDHAVDTKEEGQPNDPPPAVPGKSAEEAQEDRRVALEDIDQETLKAMLDALYGRS